MRDPNRIDKFCANLAKLWHKVPDWRFGQLMSNVLGAYQAETHRDIFFPEDEELMKFFKKYFAPPAENTIKIHGESDDIVVIRGSKLFSHDFDCFEKNVRIYFDDGTILRMEYDGTWKAVVEISGSSVYRITKLINNDDYYSDLFEIDNAQIINVVMESVKNGKNS